MAAENMTGNLPNTVNGVYQRPLPRDFESATSGDVSWKNEVGTFGWDAMPVLPAGLFVNYDSSQTGVNGQIYIGNSDSSSVQANWGAIGRYDWCRYYGDSSSFEAITPVEGQLCYDTSNNVWHTYDTSTTGWLEMQTVSGVTSYTTKTINIGDWDMDATQLVNIAHGLSATEWLTMRRVSAMIRDDSNISLINLETGYDYTTGRVSGFPSSISSTTISLARTVGLAFDNTLYDSTGFNRGWITFDYIAD